MNLVKDTSVGGYTIRVTCVQCGRVFTLSEGWSDTEGTAFVDYYCDPCAKEIEHGQEARQAPNRP